MSSFSYKSINERINGTFVGIVKDVVDKKRAGRLRVWIPELGTLEEDETGWVKCSYCSPYGGSTDFRNNDTEDFDLFEGTQTSYGFWAVPPDVNNEVIVTFINGDISRAIWIGSLFKEYLHRSVPSHTVRDNSYNLTGRMIPVSDYNKYDPRGSSSPVNPSASWLKPKVRTIGKQGLIADNKRGIDSKSSMDSEIPNVFGMSTPGPMVGDIRHGGSSFLISDADDDEFISFSTRSGAKIKISETDGFIYIINRDGTGWIEINSDGDIDMFGAGSISLRAQKDFNIRADRDINIESGRDISVLTSGDYSGNGIVHKSTQGRIYIESSGNIDVVSETEQKYESKTRKIEMTSSENFIVNSGNQLSLKSASAVTFDTGASIDLRASGNVSISGSNYKMNFSNIKVSNSGSLEVSQNIKAGNNIRAENNIGTPSVSLNAHTHSSGGSGPPSGPPGPSVSVSSSDSSAGIETDGVNIIIRRSKENVLDEFGIIKVREGNRSSTYPDWWDRKTEIVNTIVSRFNTFEPCPEKKDSK